MDVTGAGSMASPDGEKPTRPGYGIKDGPLGRQARDSRGIRQMMGTIVLSMLLCWFCTVVALMIHASRGDETIAEATAEESTHVTGAPQVSADDSLSRVR